MIARLISDVHLEFVYEASDKATLQQRQEHVNRILPPLENDDKTILLVNGDLACATKVNRIVNFFSEVAHRFRHVIYVLGNHEHYNGNIHTTETIIRNALAEFPNITIAGNTVKTISFDGVLFIACTLWTDYGKKTFRVDEIRSHISCGINDHQLVKITQSDGTTRKFHPDDGALIHADSLIDIECAVTTHDGPTVVLTHHLPSFSCVSPRFTVSHTDRIMTHAFASDLDWLITKCKPTFWLFGHTHDPFDLTIGETRLVCNPVGYPNENNQFRNKYNPTLVIEL